MHLNILNDNQKELIPFLKIYFRSHYLVGGTAIALHLGHRESLDFDMFTSKKINSTAIKKNIANSGFSNYLISEKADQIHHILNNVKITFFQFPYEIEATINYENNFRIPDLLTLDAMKAFALGGRAKWKDYVDLYFIIRDKLPISTISAKAKLLFNDAFNPVLFLKQLSYFRDISYDEKVEFTPGFNVDENIIKAFLIDAALQNF